MSTPTHTPVGTLWQHEETGRKVIEFDDEPKTVSHMAGWLPVGPVSVAIVSTPTILRGLTATGEVWFYSGRAGSAWVSQSRADSFEYDSMDVAKHRAKLFNARKSLTGLSFVAVPL